MNRRTALRSIAGVLAGLFAPPARVATPPPPGPIYDYRSRYDFGTERPRHGFRCFDARTEDEVRMVFYYDTNTGRVGRYRCDENGVCYLYTADGRGLDDPDEIWETRPLRLVPVG